MPLLQSTSITMSAIHTWMKNKGISIMELLSRKFAADIDPSRPVWVLETNPTTRAPRSFIRIHIKATMGLVDNTNVPETLGFHAETIKFDTLVADDMFVVKEPDNSLLKDGKLFLALSSPTQEREGKVIVAYPLVISYALLLDAWKTRRDKHTI